MENKEIIEGNKLVAEFDGWVIDNSFPDKDRTYIKNGGIELDTTFKYHTSWDWLMPVVQKICKLHRPSKEYFLIEKLYQSCFDNTPIKTYKAVVEFIKWYNENKNN